MINLHNEIEVMSKMPGAFSIFPLVNIWLDKYVSSSDENLEDLPNLKIFHRRVHLKRGSFNPPLRPVR